jgi:hypothetical protein
VAGDILRFQFTAKEKTMLGLKVAVVLALCFVGLLVFNLGLHLMSTPSDMAVLGGVAIMIAYISV